MFKLEDGKTYLTRDGRVVGPLWSEPDGEGARTFFSEQPLDGFMTVWEEDGTAAFFISYESDPAWDLVKELDESVKTV